MRQAHAFAVEKASDDMIELKTVRDDGVEYYALGRKITVSWRGKERYLCHSCVKVTCPHIDRIKRYRAAHAAPAAT